MVPGALDHFLSGLRGRQLRPSLSGDSRSILFRQNKNLRFQGSVFGLAAKLPQMGSDKNIGIARCNEPISRASFDLASRDSESASACPLTILAPLCRALRW